MISLFILILGWEGWAGYVMWYCEACKLELKSFLYSYTISKHNLLTTLKKPTNGLLTDWLNLTDNRWIETNQWLMTNFTRHWANRIMTKLINQFKWTRNITSSNTIHSILKMTSTLVCWKTAQKPPRRGQENTNDKLSNSQAKSF